MKNELKPCPVGISRRENKAASHYPNILHARLNFGFSASFPTQFWVIVGIEFRSTFGNIYGGFSDISFFLFHTRPWISALNKILNVQKSARFAGFLFQKSDGFLDAVEGNNLVIARDGLMIGLPGATKKPEGKQGLGNVFTLIRIKTNAVTITSLEHRQ